MTAEILVSRGKTAARRNPRPRLDGRGWRRWLGGALERMTKSFLALWLLATVWVVASFVAPPRDYLRAAEWQLDGGPVEGYAVGEPRMIQSGPEPVWVVRHDHRAFSALAAVCQYQHCVLRWNPAHRVFSCPCHHGTYDVGGRVLAGPARRDLRRFFVNVKGERVRVHLRRLVEAEP